MQILARLKQKLFRWQGDGVLPFRLSQRRVFILPTRSGLLFTVALMAMLLGSINYNLSLGYALVFLLAGIGITGMIHTFRNLFGLIIAPGTCDPVFASETAHFRLQLRNDRASSRLALSFVITEGQSIHLSLRGNSLAEVALPIQSLQRGWLSLPRVRLSTVYPLGLFVAWSYLQPEMRCLIYPKPLPSPLPLPAGSEQAGHQKGESGQDDFAGFRDRQPADSLRHVAWKASARDTGERPLLLKLFSGGSAAELQLDWALTAESALPETRISQLTAWVLAAEAENIPYGLRLPGVQIAINSGQAHQQHCLETLALFEA